MSLRNFEFVRGDTFSVFNTTALTIETVSGTISDFTGWSGASQIREARTKALVADLTFEWVDASAGLWRIKSSSATTDWPVKLLLCDVEFTSPTGEVVSTRAFGVNILEDITTP